MLDSLFNWYKNFVDAISSSEMYEQYISTLPAPLNNVAFLSIAAIVIVVLIVKAVIGAIYRAVKRARLRQRIREEAELNKPAKDDVAVAKVMAKVIEKQTAETESLKTEKETLAAEKEELQTKAEDLEQKLFTSVHDGLTGLQNRRVFSDQLNEFNAENKEYVIVCFDVNNLKTTNDTFGHAKGDELLTTVTEAISRHFGEDNVYRVGGDEFNVLISADDFSEDKLAKIDADLEAVTLEKNDGVHYQVAFGFAYKNEGEDAAQVMSLADQRMYENKQQKKGKNGNV